MLDTICMSETQTNFGRGEIPTFSCVHVVPDKPSPCKDQKLVRCCKELLTKVQLAENNHDLLLRDQFKLLESSICRQCQTAGLPMPELPVHDYDHLLSVAETLVQTAQEHAERAATARQQAALGRWQKKLQISSKTDKKQVHSWLRGGLSQVPKAFKDEHGQYTSSTNKMLDMLTSYTA